ncbi:MAG: hypothetical protein R3F11_18400 [Verrucomicrobiales bacterium]
MESEDRTDGKSLWRATWKTSVAAGVVLGCWIQIANRFDFRILVIGGVFFSIVFFGVLGLQQMREMRRAVRDCDRYPWESPWESSEEYRKLLPPAFRRIAVFGASFIVMSIAMDALGF